MVVFFLRVVDLSYYKLEITAHKLGFCSTNIWTASIQVYIQSIWDQFPFWLHDHGYHHTVSETYFLIQA